MSSSSSVSRSVSGMFPPVQHARSYSKHHGKSHHGKSHHGKTHYDKSTSCHDSSSCKPCKEDKPKVVTKCTSYTVESPKEEKCRPVGCDKTFRACAEVTTCCLPPVLEEQVGPAQQIQLMLSQNSAQGHASAKFEVTPHKYTNQATVRYSIHWKKLGTYTPSYRCTSGKVIRGPAVPITVGAIRLRGPFGKKQDQCDPFDCQAPVIANLSLPRVVSSGYEFAMQQSKGLRHATPGYGQTLNEAILSHEYHNIHEVNVDSCSATGTIDLTEEYACMILKGEVLVEILPIFTVPTPPSAATTSTVAGSVQFVSSATDFPAFNEVVESSTIRDPTKWSDACAVGPESCGPYETRVYYPMRGRLHCTR